MNTNMQGHNHGGKNHLLGMLGIGALVLVVLVLSGRSFSQALPLAAFLACPLMMIGMMFMMRSGNGNGNGNGHQDGSAANDVNDANGHREHDDGSNPRGNEVAAPWQDSPNMARPQDTAGPGRPSR